jgi:glycine hydroxymethyltransferase
MPGKPAAKALAQAGIECNYNTIPFDPRKPMDPSGVRIGTPSVTSRGMKEAEMRQIADWIQDSLVHAEEPQVLERIRRDVATFCARFPAPGIRI